MNIPDTWTILAHNGTFVCPHFTLVGLFRQNFLVGMPKSKLCLPHDCVTSLNKALLVWWTQHCFYSEKQLAVASNRNELSVQEKIEMLDKFNKHPQSKRSCLNPQNSWKHPYYTD